MFELRKPKSWEMLIEKEKKELDGNSFFFVELGVKRSPGVADLPSKLIMRKWPSAGLCVLAAAFRSSSAFSLMPLILNLEFPGVAHFLQEQYN